MSESTVRWYVPAYRGTLGNVIPCGTQTVRQEDAEDDVALKNGSGYTTPVFVAYRDMPEWVQVERPMRVDPDTGRWTCCGADSKRLDAFHAANCPNGN
jgi:hypothetical protein